MSLIAAKISKVALQDMIELFSVQPWLLNSSEELSELWEFCETREEQILIKSLIADFCLFDATKEAQALRGINEAVQAWGLSPKSTWIVATANKNEIDGSTAGLQKLKNKITPMEEWHSKFIANIPSAVEVIKTGQAVIIFDDFIGSGSKMLKKRDWLSKLLEAAGVVNVDYYYLSFSGMQAGIEYIKETGSTIYSHFSLKKGITDKYPAAEAEKMIEIMLKIESRLGVKYKKKDIQEFSLGYKKSEALYSGENDNCPNNVFPFFWWPVLRNGKKLKTLLTRVG